MADEEELTKILQHFEEKINHLDKGYNSLDQKVSKMVSPYPMYIARNDDQMYEELAAKGKLEMEKPGVGDNVRKTFSYFVQTTDKGDPIPGLESKHKAMMPVPFFEMIETENLFSFVYQFTPVGYVIEFLRGVSSAIEDAKCKPEEIIKDVNVANDIQSALKYYSNEKQLTELLNEGRKYKWEWDNTNNVYKLVDITPSPLDPNEKLLYRFVCCTPNGPKMIKRKIPRKDTDKITPLSCD